VEKNLVLFGREGGENEQFQNEKPLQRKKSFLNIFKTSEEKKGV